MSAENCNRCRFWKFAEDGGEDEDDQPYGWGWCRRYPPTISDHMAAISVGTPRFGQQYDPDELASPINVHQSCLSPSTFSSDWCGEFARTAPEIPL